MPLNLTRAQIKLESLMDDVCKITRDTQGTSDDDLDEDTGLITAPVGDEDTVYEGKCFFAPTGIGSDANAEGQPERNVGYRTLRGYLPLDAPEILENDVFTLTSSLRDPGSVGRRMVVIGIRWGTFAVARTLELSDVR